jgi:hypothetical protein
MPRPTFPINLTAAKTKGTKLFKSLMPFDINLVSDAITDIDWTVWKVTSVVVFVCTRNKG